MQNNIIDKLTYILKKPEIIFTIIALIFGIILIFVTPFGEVSDERTHFKRVVEVSQGQFYNTPPHKLVQPNSYEFHGASGYSPMMYAASSLSIKCFPKFQLVGRFANLFIWILLIAFAIRITPVFKWAFLFTALLPMSIFQGMSYSADSFSNAFSFLYFAYIFKLIYKEFSYKKDLPILFLFAIIGAFSKGIFAPLFLLPFAKIEKHKWLIFVLLLFITGGLSYLWSTNNYLATISQDATIYNKLFVVEHPFEFLILILKTVKTHFLFWTCGIIGLMGSTLIELEKIFYILSTIIFFAVFAFIPEKVYVKASHKIISGIIFIGYAIVTFILMFFMATKIGAETIGGIQGRYFISALPLLFVIFSYCKNDNKFSDSIKRISLIFLIMQLIHCSVIIFKAYNP